MFELSERISLALFLVGLPVVMVLVRSMTMPGRHLFLAGYLALLGARIFTVAEGMMWSEQYNLLEHVCYALSGALFWLACMQTRRKGAAQDR